jgi:hypothetical protein
MNEETKRELETNLEEFRKLFWDNFEKAYKSGAIDPDSDAPTIVMKCVLRITAEQCTPYSDYGKKMLNNLRHFV